MAFFRVEAPSVWNTRTGIWALALLLSSCFLSSNLAKADPEPGPFYLDSPSSDPESLHMLQRLRILAQRGREINEQEREIADEALAIEGMLEARAIIGNPHFAQSQISEEDIGEPLPLPSAVRAAPRWEKRGSYMALCHFKICNMGRKRQL